MIVGRSVRTEIDGSPARTIVAEVRRPADGEEIYVTRPLANTVNVLNALTRAVIRSIDGGTPRRLSMHPDGLTLAIANESGWVTFVR